MQRRIYVSTLVSLALAAWVLSASTACEVETAGSGLESGQARSGTLAPESTSPGPRPIAPGPCGGTLPIWEQCTCTPTTCAAASAQCGQIDDGCGDVLDCGGCTAPAVCGGGGVANACGVSNVLPQVPNRSGEILVAPGLVTIVASNDASSGTDTAANLQAFSAFLPSSTVWSAVASEYGVGALSPSAPRTGAPLSGVQTKAALQSYVASAVAAGAPAPNGDTIYLVYLPAAASLSTADFGSECGEHFQYPGSGTDAIAVVRRCGTEQAQETQLGQLTRDASHEVIEAATNPRQGGYNFNETVTAGVSDVWAVWNGGDVELADLCEGTRIFESPEGSPAGGWELQRIWSNAAATLGGDPCVPALSDPYYSVSIPSGWYGAPVGGSVEIPLTGWSSGMTENWFVNDTISVAVSSGAFTSSDAVITSGSLGVGTAAGCGARYAMNEGGTATLTVTVPPGASIGDYVIVQVTSFDEDAPLCNPPMSKDFQHFWPVGVFVY